MLLSFGGSCAHKVNSVRTRDLLYIDILALRTLKSSAILTNGPFADLLVLFPYHEKLCAYECPAVLEITCGIRQLHLYVCQNGEYKYYTHEEFEKFEQSTEFENAIVWLGELLKVK